MTILAMTTAVQRHTIARTRTASQLASSDDERSNAISQLAALVPTPVIALWAAALGLVRPSQAWLRWTMLAGTIVFLAAIVVLDAKLADKAIADRFKEEKKANPPTTSATKIRWMVGIAGASFVLWALATPGSPAELMDEHATRWFAVAAIAGSYVLYRVARLKDLVSED